MLYFWNYCSSVTIGSPGGGAVGFNCVAADQDTVGRLLTKADESAYDLICLYIIEVEILRDALTYHRRRPNVPS